LRAAPFETVTNMDDDARRASRVAAAADASQRLAPTAAGASYAIEPDRAERAAIARVEELIRRTTDHQNAHVKLRAQLALEIDRARWESDQSDFRLAELQATLEGFLQALRTRVKSRLDTAAQLRQDSESQLSQLRKADLRSLLAAHQSKAQRALKQRGESVETLQAMAEQLANHVELQVTTMQHDLAAQGTHDPASRLAVSKQAVVSSARTERDSLDSVARMLDDFASQMRSQLAELKAEREHFERRLTIRINEISSLEARRAPPKTESVAGTSSPARRAAAATSNAATASRVAEL
jgi:chromosome segregation ATPase